MWFVFMVVLTFFTLMFMCQKLVVKFFNNKLAILLTAMVILLILVILEVQT